MSAYSLDDERTIRAGRHVRDWMKSGLLTPQQYEQITPELQVDLRRTNAFLRLVLFVFTTMILQAALGLVAVLILAVFFADMGGEARTAVLCALGAIFCFWLAGFLADRYRLYRFGIEEAAAIGAIGLMGGAAAIGMSVAGYSNDVTFAAGLLAGGAVALVVFLRFGYLYAAVAATACAAGLPFVFDGSFIIQRVVSITVLAAVAAAAWMKRAEYGDEHPGETYGLLEAISWVGIYFVITLEMFDAVDRVSWTYWPTYAAMWIVPLLGLWLSIRSRHRMLLDVSIVMLLASLMLNKEYLGGTRYPWDPIVFGLVLMITAIAIKRWLASGENADRDGFTATRILASEKSSLVAVGTVASLAHPGTPAAPPSAPADPIGGGGRSGGAGAGGAF